MPSTPIKAESIHIFNLKVIKIYLYSDQALKTIFLYSTFVGAYLTTYANC